MSAVRAGAGLRSRPPEPAPGAGPRNRPAEPAPGTGPRNRPPELRKRAISGSLTTIMTRFFERNRVTSRI